MFSNIKIKVYFQPIISIKDKKIFAFEALVRGFDKKNNLITPDILLEKAKNDKVIEKFDNYIRQKAIGKFKSYYDEDENLLLFLNFESSVIEKSEKYNFNLDFVKEVERLNINKKNIVLEIKEDTISNIKALNTFCKRYKDLGFIIAIDDFGTGYSSFDRLAIIQPDIVKIDRSLISNIENNYINSSILKSIVDISNKIGALTLAEGVETKEEILTCMKNHIEIYQGFYFEKAIDEIKKETKESLLNKINIIGLEYKDAVKKHMKTKQAILKRMKHLTKDVVKMISFEQNFHLEKLELILKENNNIEAIYLIDYNLGNQINDTLINNIQNRFYKASKHNDDHNLKEYYYITKESKTKEFLSQKYISKATGSMCRTYSKTIKINQSRFILCFDILTD